MDTYTLKAHQNKPGSGRNQRKYKLQTVATSVHLK